MTPSAVVQGHSPQTGWPDLAEAALAIRAGALWVAANVDSTLPSERGLLPGQRLDGRRAAHRHRQRAAGGGQAGADVDGRMRWPAAIFDAPLVVGDRLDTDIAGANAAGLPSLMVLTGVNSAARHRIRRRRASGPTTLPHDLRLAAHRAETLRIDGASGVARRRRRRAVTVQRDRRSEAEDALTRRAGDGASGVGRRSGERHGRWPETTRPAPRCNVVAVACRSASVISDMSTDPDQIRDHVAALLAELPDIAPSRWPGRSTTRHRRHRSAPRAGARPAGAGAGIGRDEDLRRPWHGAHASTPSWFGAGWPGHVSRPPSSSAPAGSASTGMPAAKPATAVAVHATLTVEDADERTWVSRGAHKLIGALDAFGIDGGRPALPRRRRVDRRIHRGAAGPRAPARSSPSTSATASWRGRCAPTTACTVMERTNVRALTPERSAGPVDLVVADLSFISLATVLPALTACASADADIVPMVKPQFEVGKDRVGAGGVVSDPALRAEAVLAVARRAAELDWHTVGVTASPLPGPSGNVEYFLRLRADPRRAADRATISNDAVRAAVDEGPQVTQRERTVLLVVHTGRDEATETARRVEKVLGDNGIGLRVLAAEAVDRGSLHLAPDDMRALGVEIEVVDADEQCRRGLRAGAGARR